MTTAEQNALLTKHRNRIAAETAAAVKALEADALDFAALASRRWFGGDYEGAKQALDASKAACLRRLELLNPQG